jgi:hypothetical protein
LIVTKWWTSDSSTNDEYYLRVAMNAFLFVKEYSSVMFFYRKEKQIQQLISSCTGDVEKLFLYAAHKHFGVYKCL